MRLHVKLGEKSMQNRYLEEAMGTKNIKKQVTVLCVGSMVVMTILATVLIGCGAKPQEPVLTIAKETAEQLTQSCAQVLHDAGASLGKTGRL